MKTYDTKYALIFLDTETTGIESKDRLCQLAYKLPTDTYESMFDELYTPPLPIAIDAMAIHHITNKMIADKPAFTESSHFADVKKLIQDPKSVTIAHNAPFDNGMLEKEGIIPTQFIDTLKIARHLDPEGKIPKYNMQYLRYFLELDNDITVPIQAHDAKGDVIVLEHLFARLLKSFMESKKLDTDGALTEMIRISLLPSLILRINFGKHRGKLVTDVAKEDSGYLRWLYEQKLKSEEDETDWIFTLEKAMGIDKQPKLLAE
jgi:exodeoxyribonuclease X